jgi:hypothetical protein
LPEVKDLYASVFPRTVFGRGGRLPSWRRAPPRRRINPNVAPVASLFVRRWDVAVVQKVPPDGGDCEQLLAKFAQTGIDMDKLAEQLQEEGAKSFSKSLNSLMDVVSSKSAVLKKAS